MKPLVLVFILALSVLHPAHAQDAYGSVGLGYPISLSVGVEDAIAPTTDVRIDVSFYGLVLLFPYVEGVAEVSASALQTFPSGLYVGGGPHIAIGRSTNLLAEGGSLLSGTYLGAQGIVGYEPGEGRTRFFVETGLVAGFKVSGGEGINTRIRPRLTVGLNFPF